MRTSIYVLSHGTQWKVKCEHCQEAVVSTQLEAINMAKKHVTNLGQGKLSQILVQRNDGKFRAEWTYRQDPFPPRG